MPQKVNVELKGKVCTEENSQQSAGAKIPSVLVKLQL